MIELLEKFLDEFETMVYVYGQTEVGLKFLELYEQKGFNFESIIKEMEEYGTTNEVELPY